MKENTHDSLSPAELDYDYAALEPHISGRIMELHHSKHHATYVAGLNATSASWPRHAKTARSQTRSPA